jgi:uncharacterized protein (TIGR00255 family)
MTGFGSGRAAVGSEDLTVELRSVNSKFCEVKARLPRELLALESVALRAVKDGVARGGIDVTVRRGAGGGSDLAPHIDEALAARYVETFRGLRDRLGLAGDVSLADVLGATGVLSVEERTPDLDAAGEALRAALGQALERLVAMREQEGSALRDDLAARLESIRSFAAQVAEEAPISVRQQQERIAQRVKELTGGIALDPQRLAQEVALLAERSDVAEELTRLDSHLAQFGQLLDASDPVGRRMDFLVQEMNREVNTVASKAQWAPIAALAVELKAEIERIREQVQNVE